MGVHLLAFLHSILPPSSPEAWGFATLVFTTLAGGVGYLVKSWSDRRVRAETAKAKEAADAAIALAALQERIIVGAERREEGANRRTEAALQGLGQLSAVTTELSTTNKMMLDELRRTNANYESMLRQR